MITNIRSDAVVCATRENALEVDIMDLIEFEKKIPEYKEPHRNDFFSIILLKKMDGYITIDTTRYSINSSTILIIPPDKVRSFNWQNTPEGMVLFFDPELMLLGPEESFRHLLLMKYGLVHIKKIKSDEENMFHKLISLIQDQNKINTENTRRAIHYLINSLLIQLEIFKQDIKVKVSSGRAEEVLYKYEQMINLNFHKMKKPKEYASELGVSTNHLNKLVNSIYGKTSSQLINERIILEAKRLLAHTNYTVSYISDILSFGYLSYFIRFFKKNTGFTPEEYRRK